MNLFLKTTIACCISTALIGCGSDSSDSEPTTAKVSFSIADAPVDNALEVNVTYQSITLKRNGEDDIELPLVDEEGNEAPQQINLLDYQNGDSLLILSEVELPVGDYQELIINTQGCPQNQNGSTEDCNVVEEDGSILPLKTPSNKLRLGGFTVSVEATQAYTIDFNLRKSLVSTANESSYNLKPHGVTIVDNQSVGSIFGSVDANLFMAGETCEADTGNVVYLYAGLVDETSVLGDEFDPDVDNNVPEDVVAPYASKMLQLDDSTDLYSYSFNFLPAGDYTLAFSCSAVNDDPEYYDEIMIADPAEQTKQTPLAEGENLMIDFAEIVE